MNIAEARALDYGLEFYLHEKNMTLNVYRDPDGKIKIFTENYIKPFKREVKSFRTYLTTFFLALVFVFIHSSSMHTGTKVLLTLGVAWVATFLYYASSFQQAKNTSSYKYHAAEHKILNYMDKYNTSTDNVEEVMKMSSFSFRCGTTLVAVVYVFVTLITLGVVFIPGIILKILWFAFSIYATLYLWANGKCYFFQKFAIIEPSYAEVELATIGLTEYLKLKHDNC